jgi:hypothetical protein
MPLLMIFAAIFAIFDITLTPLRHADYAIDYADAIDALRPPPLIAITYFFRQSLMIYFRIGYAITLLSPAGH